MKLVSISLAAALAQGAPPPSARAPDNPLHIEDADALRHFTAGMEAWLAEDFATAQAELEAAYAIEPVPELLYSLGQLSRLQGDCTQARARFFAYLETGPKPEAAEDTRINIERCEPEEPELPEVAPPPDPSTKPPIETTPSPARAPKRPDPLGLGLTVLGSALAITGAGLFGAAFVERDRAGDELGVNAFERRIERSRAEYWSGVGLTSVGVAVLVGGVVRLVIVRQRARRSTRTAAWRR